MIELRTKRTVLRRWTDADRSAFHALNSDPHVMATIGPVMTVQQSDGFLDLINRHFNDHGYGLWCVDVEGEPIGFTGLLHPAWRDGLEIGWRIKSEYWGNGYAPEAAAVVLRHAFGPLGFDEIISFTAQTNHKSIRVMEKIGLRYDPDSDFDHPSVPDGSPLRPHVLYRLAAEEHGRLTAGDGAADS